MLNPGTVVGTYTVVRKIGSGGFGAVYEAIRGEGTDRFALKITPGENPEAAILGQLDHSRIPQLIDQFSADEGYVTVTSLVVGDSLADILARKKHRPDAIAIAIKDVASAVAYAHQSGVAHRDIKPENILVDSAGRGTLIDWGAACLVDRAVESNAGTVPYMHPTALTKLAGLQSAESGASWPQQDIYSLGIVLFEAAAGRLPFATPDEQTSVIAQSRQLLGELPQLKASIDAATDVPATLRSIVIACTDSADRSYSNCHELVHDLTAYIHRKPLRHAQESTATRRDRLWRRYGRWLLTGAAMVIVSTALFAADRWNTQSTLSRIRSGAKNQRGDVLSTILETGVFPDSQSLRQQRALTAHAVAAKCLESENPETATKLLRNALTLTPASGELHSDLGTALFQLGEFDQAIEAFSQALKRPCDHASVLSNRGAAFGALGDSESARRDFLAALQENPDHAEAKRHLEMLNATESPPLLQ